MNKGDVNLFNGINILLNIINCFVCILCDFEFKVTIDPDALSYI